MIDKSKTDDGLQIGEITIKELQEKNYKKYCNFADGLVMENGNDVVYLDAINKTRARIYFITTMKAMEETAKKYREELEEVLTE